MVAGTGRPHFPLTGAVWPVGASFGLYGGVMPGDGDRHDDFATYGPLLRARLVANLGRHERLALDLDGHRHAAVAVVVVDSDASRHGDDHHAAAPDELDRIPGAAHLRLSGSVAGTAGGPAVLLTRRAAKLRARRRPVGPARRPGG